MKGRSVSTSTFFVTTALLVALTVLTVGVSFVELETKWHVASGLAIAVLKASLVALFFMQLVVSPRLTWCVGVAVILFLVVLFSLTYSDYLTRSQLPFAPGH
jgi:cytochrome c oxidase subunit 4